MSELEAGLQAWRQMSNHNDMIERQRGADHDDPERNGTVEIAYFGSSAFRITTPQGLTLMIDPWRNYPSRRWDWYFRDFPCVPVDIGVSSHAHFDHDALNRLDAHVLLDRLIGTYAFSDLRMTGIAEKHATDSSQAMYDFRRIIQAFGGIDIRPPNNPRSWDHCLLLIETGGLRILHWGDNRHNPDSAVWERLGHVDILLLPVDQSQHVLAYDMLNEVIEKLKPHVVIPHHYYIWDLTVRSSTLLPADEWVNSVSHCRLDGPIARFESSSVRRLDREVYFFGDHVAFDKDKWRAGEYEATNLNP
ncbi:MAG: MBL fold metallo-hydrolase [Pseudomonadota bacterium]